MIGGRMKNKSFVLLTAVLIFISLTVFNEGQSTESYMQQFQRNLMDSFIGPMSAEGKEVTPQLRAMFMGYILNRQSHRIGEFEMDKIRMKNLISEVREFLKAVSPGEDLWPIVDAGLQGQYNNDVDTMLGGSPYVESVFPTLDDMARDWRDWEYSLERFSSYPDRQLILNVVQNFLQLLKAKSYQEALKLCGGRCYENFSKWLEAASQSQVEFDRFNQYFAGLEWREGPAGMADTDPPMVQITFNLREQGDDWDEDPCILILDYGVWKIARFLD
jgi:hypothetical protein